MDCLILPSTSWVNTARYWEVAETRIVFNGVSSVGEANIDPGFIDKFSAVAFFLLPKKRPSVGFFDGDASVVVWFIVTTLTDGFDLIINDEMNVSFISISGVLSKEKSVERDGGRCLNPCELPDSFLISEPINRPPPINKTKRLPMAVGTIHGFFFKVLEPHRRGLSVRMETLWFVLEDVGHEVFLLALLFSPVTLGFWYT